jgi:hypothetical protein
MMNPARETVWGQPLVEGIRVKERPVNALWRSLDDAMEPYGIRSHD